MGGSVHFPRTPVPERLAPVLLDAGDRLERLEVFGVPRDIAAVLGSAVIRELEDYAQAYRISIISRHQAAGQGLRVETQQDHATFGEYHGRFVSNFS